MHHLHVITRPLHIVAKADSILVKQAQLELIAQGVAVIGDVAALVKGAEGGEEEA